MTKFNLTLLTKQEQDDIALEKHASMLIRQMKNGQISKQPLNLNWPGKKTLKFTQSSKRI